MPNVGAGTAVCLLILTACAPTPASAPAPASASTPASSTGSGNAAADPQDRIAFTRWDEGGVGHPRLWTGNIDGSDLRPVGEQQAEYPDWSPDRTHLLITYFEQGTVGIARINPDGSGFAPLTDDFMSEAADYSPDASTIAFDRSPVADQNDPRFTTSLWVMAADGSNQRQLLDPAEAGFDYEPEYSPDGSQIVFIRYNSSADASAVYTVAVDGTGVRLLSPYVAYVEHARWSPDGSTIIYNVEYQADLDDPRNGIWTVPANGGDPTLLLATTREMHGFKPDYSPDGERIVFGCLMRQVRNDELCVMGADGTGVTRLTTTRTFENHPIWD